MLVLLYLYNPLVSSLRSIQRASELKNVQRKLGCGRVSLGSLSESARVFDAELLAEVAAELGHQLEPVGADRRLKEVQHTITLVDGTLLKALPTLVEAALYRSKPKPHYNWRLHTHFELFRHRVTRFEVTGGTNRGAASEKAVLQRQLQPDHCYVTDRGYVSYALFNQIHDLGSSYVCRLKESLCFEAQQSRPLSDEATAADIVRDEVGRLGHTSGRHTEHPVRVIEIKMAPHLKRPQAGKDFKQKRDRLLIATNLLDVPAEVIGLIYRYRWTIELFFRFFKQVLGCRHLISNDPGGIAIQVYCAIIACMLISLWSGRKPTLVSYEMVGHYLTGLATEEEVLAHFGKLKLAAS